MAHQRGLAVGAASSTIPTAAGLAGPGLRIWAETYARLESELTVRALVANSGGGILVLLSADLLWFPDDVAAAIRDAVADVAGTTPAHVLLNASHAHSVPPLPTTPISDPTADHDALRRFGDDVVVAALEATRNAKARLRPARMGTGRGTTPIGVYRRAFDARGRGHLGEVPDRAIDRIVPVVRFDDLDGQPIAVLFSYGCHPVLYGPVARAISSDYPGAARTFVERALTSSSGPPDAAITPVVGMFLQGCGGDINPRHGIGVEHDPLETKDREGTVLGAEVVRVAAEIRTNTFRGPKAVFANGDISGWPWLPVQDHASLIIDASFETVTLPLSPLPSREVAEVIRAEHASVLRQAEARHAAAPELRLRRRWVEWSERLVDAVATRSSTIEVPIQAVRLGDLAILGIGMEVFSDTGVAIRADSPLPATVVLGYTNGYHGYLPRDVDLPEGGWSATERYALPDLYPQAWLQPTAIGPTAERIVVQASKRLLDEIARDVHAD